MCGVCAHVFECGYTVYYKVHINYVHTVTYGCILMDACAVCICYYILVPYTVSYVYYINFCTKVILQPRIE